MAWVAFLLAALGAYVVGATPFGYLAGRLRGIDIREHGSGNIGATNVVRVLGKGIGLPTFALDMLKGVVPVWLASLWAGAHWLPGHTTDGLRTVAGLCAILGHNFTFWLGFKGGKGVATSAGVMLALVPVALGAALVLWGITLVTTRYVSVASMIAGLTLPLVVLAEGWKIGHMPWIFLALTLAIALLTIVRHRPNIQRLLAGTEAKMGAKKPVG